MDNGPAPTVGGGKIYPLKIRLKPAFEKHQLGLLFESMRPQSYGSVLFTWSVGGHNFSHVTKSIIAVNATHSYKPQRSDSVLKVARCVALFGFERWVDVCGVCGVCGGVFGVVNVVL